MLRKHDWAFWASEIRQKMELLGRYKFKICILNSVA